MTPPQAPRPEHRSSRRKPPKGTTKVRAYRGALGLGANLAVALLDVSETGARLLLKADLPKDAEIEVHLDNIVHRPVKALANVVWSVATADGKYCVGARFQKLFPYPDLLSLSR
jgi:hypothetical protein